MRATRAEESVDVRALADEDLVPLMARGDARAFEAIYERHAGAAYSLAYRMVGARASAEDVTQEAFMNLWRSGAHYDRRRGSVRTWVLGIVHHRAIDALRRASVHSRRRSDDETAAERLEAPERRPRAPEEGAGAGGWEAPGRAEEAAPRRDEAATVRAAIDHLPADQVKVIELAYFGGFTHVEIADMLDTPVGTVKGRMRLGLKKLHEALGHGAVASEAVTSRPKGVSPRGEAE